LAASTVPAGWQSPGRWAALRSRPTLVGDIARPLLDHHFPESLHEDILAAVGLTPEVRWVRQRRHDPRFRRRVLVAYDYHCAVCGLDLRLGAVAVALDTAHIRWHRAGGPDREDNGLALCVLHHNLFDLGAFTLGRDGIVLVCDDTHGTTGFEEVQLRHHGGRARPPQWSE
jgi:putative restriction endonuclease